MVAVHWYELAGSDELDYDVGRRPPQSKPQGLTRWLQARPSKGEQGHGPIAQDRRSIDPPSTLLLDDQISDPRVLNARSLRGLAAAELGALEVTKRSGGFRSTWDLRPTARAEDQLTHAQSANYEAPAGRQRPRTRHAM